MWMFRVGNCPRYSRELLLEETATLLRAVNTGAIAKQTALFGEFWTESLRRVYICSRSGFPAENSGFDLTHAGSGGGECRYFSSCLP